MSGATSNYVAAISSGAVTSKDEEINRRLKQIAEDQDHKLCSQATKRSLKDEMIAPFKLLTREVERDNWKFSKYIYTEGGNRYGPQISPFF
mmetsp:Transcript_7672/g.11144  ORF Transcript_7672/g.11144 Transcript_7672/m.11144 type:complete len:91 (+) Transcript_7672:54-326(+)